MRALFLLCNVIKLRRWCGFRITFAAKCPWRSYMNIRTAHIHYLMKGADTLNHRQHPSNTISLITLDLCAIEAVSISFFFAGSIFAFIFSSVRICGLRLVSVVHGPCKPMGESVPWKRWLKKCEYSPAPSLAEWNRTESKPIWIGQQLHKIFHFYHSLNHLPPIASENAISWALFVQHWNINIMFAACDKSLPSTESARTEN